MTLINSVGRVETVRVESMRVSAVAAAHPVLALPLSTSVATSAHRDRLPMPYAGRYDVADVQRAGWRTETGRHGACGTTGGTTGGDIVTNDTAINHNSMKFSSRLGRSCSPPV